MISFHRMKREKFYRRLKNKLFNMSSPIRTARELRRKMTPEEDLLWQILRNRGIKGKKVRRQHPVVYEQASWRKGFYVADFYCARCKLVIELDGKQHEFGSQLEYDKVRDVIMNKMGLKIIRIKNEDLRKDLYAVLTMIEAAL